MTSSPSHFISQTIEKLRQLTQINILTNWRYCAADLSVEEATSTHFFLHWSIAHPNAKGHIAWPAGRQVLWLAQRFVIPPHLQSYPVEGLTLRLALTWWAEDAQIFVNGQLVQQGDLFDFFTRIMLSPSAIPGEEITVALRLLSPSHGDGALMRSWCVYESPHHNRLEPGFIADELAVLQRYLEAFAPEKLPILAAAMAEIDWEAVTDAPKFEQSLLSLRQNLLQSKILQQETPPPNPLPVNEEGAGREVKTTKSQQSKIHLLGHAHLDMAWLWPVSDTWEAAQRTFESVLKLQQDFPHFIFCHSSPALYAWIEQHRPDLFAAIQQQLASGRWEIVGGMWIEPDLNLIDGESIVRQILYAQRYFQEKFGQLSKVEWLPDSFGFCATLPQFLKQGGIEYFVTQKLRWNDTTKFPYEVFWWRSPDGTQIFSCMSALIGEDIDPIKMATYAWEWETKTGLKDALWLPGVGDRGGGPTRDMLEVAQRWEKSPFFPQLEFSTAYAYLEHLNHQLSPSPITNHQSPLPIWNNELYLEFHRGCYTTHAEQKRWNRRCEGLLYQAELFASLATLSTGSEYPKASLENAWKKVLFNQFHDILPGTSISQVFVEANQAWQEVEQVGSEILERSLNAIASQITLPPPPQPDALPIIIFNPLNWQRSEVVAVPLPETAQQDWQICDGAGKPLLSQQVTVETNSQKAQLLFLATEIPSVGYRVFWLCPQTTQQPAPRQVAATTPQKSTEITHNTNSIPFSDSSADEKKYFPEKDWILENEFLRVTVDNQTGNLSNLFDKANNREILNESGGNQLQSFQDSGQYWDAWNIDPHYAQHPLPPNQLQSIQWVEQGILQTRLRVVRQLGKSEFYQDYVLQAGSPILKIVTTVDWQERHVLVKAAFPLNLQAESATYEIACGAIERPTQPQTPAETAKWEVPALRWADLTQMSHEEDSNPSPIYGVSLLNDGKYGYDCQPHQLRLTLLRSPSWPDPNADQGHHEFTYALYPHSGSWQSAHTVRRGYELNLPLQVMVLPPEKEQTNASLPPAGQLLNLSADNLILIAFKQSENNPHQWILRCYECHGKAAELKLQSDLELKMGYPVNLLEHPTQIAQYSPEEQRFSIAPWQIFTLTVMAHIKSG